LTIGALGDPVPLSPTAARSAVLNHHVNAAIDNPSIANPQSVNRHSTLVNRKSGAIVKDVKACG
jgi:hypothetical protein